MDKQMAFLIERTMALNNLQREGNFSDKEIEEIEDFMIEVERAVMEESLTEVLIVLTQDPRKWGSLEKSENMIALFQNRYREMVLEEIRKKKGK